VPPAPPAPDRAAFVRWSRRPSHLTGFVELTRIAVKWKAPLEGTASEHEEAAPPFVEIIRDAATAAAALKPRR